MFFGFFVPAVFLCIVFYALWRDKPGFQKEYRTEVEGLPDILRYAHPLNSKVVQLKNGELLAGFFFRGRDMESSTNNEIMGMMGRLNTMLCKFGSGWMMHVDNAREYALEYHSADHFPHPVLKLMNAEREAQFTAEGRHYESRFALFITWLPPSKLESRMMSMIYESSDKKLTSDAEASRKNMQVFEQKLGELELAMKGMLHDVLRIKHGAWIEEPNGNAYAYDPLASYLNFCITGRRRRVRVSRNSRSDLDYLVGSYDFVGGTEPTVDGMHMRVVSIEGFPSEASPQVLERLNRLQVRYRWSTRYIFQDTQRAKARLERIKKMWGQKVRPFLDEVMGRNSGVLDLDAQKMATDALMAMNELESGDVKNGFYTSAIVLMDEDESAVIEGAKQIKGMMDDLMFPARVEDSNSVEAFLGTLPGHGYENVREFPIHTMNLAYLFPATATWSGVPVHPSKFYKKNSPPLFQANAYGSTPFNGVMHHDDIGHAVIVGGTGGGKSTLAQFLNARHFQYEFAATHLFEKGYSGAVLCDAIEGNHFDIGSEGWKGGFAPLADTDTVTGRKWAEEYIEVLLALQNYVVTPKTRLSIKAALKRHASEPLDSRDMTRFVNFLDDEQLRMVLSFYTVGGDNYLIDSKPTEESINLTRLNVFEMEHLMEMGERYVVPILLYLFRKIEKTLQLGKPTLIILDEAWLMLQHPLFKERIKVWLKTLRKANAYVWFFTQELGDLAKSTIRDAIYASCPTKILLPNDNATSEAERPLYAELGLNDQQIEMIANAQKKRDYYYLSPYGHRMFQLELGPMNLAFVGVSGKEEVAEARALKAELGAKKWVIEWTRRRAGADWARALELLYEKEAKNDPDYAGNVRAVGHAA